MKLYNKKSLELKEQVYKRKNVVLKEDDTVHVNDVSGMVDGLNKDGDVTVAKNTNQKTIDVPILTQNNKVNANDLTKSDALKSALNVAKAQPNTTIDITASKVNGNVTPISQTTNGNGLTMEGVSFTKKEMNNFLMNL